MLHRLSAKADIIYYTGYVCSVLTKVIPVIYCFLLSDKDIFNVKLSILTAIFTFNVS